MRIIRLPGMSTRLATQGSCLQVVITLGKRGLTGSAKTFYIIATFGHVSILASFMALHYLPIST